MAAVAAAANAPAAAAASAAAEAAGATAPPLPPSRPTTFQRLLEEQARARSRAGRGGIAFQCLITPSELHTDQHQQLCLSASKTATALAAQNKIRFGQAARFP